MKFWSSISRKKFIRIKLDGPKAFIGKKPCENLRGTKYKKYPQEDVYCTGDLLHEVQIQNVYPDSKTFVDKKMKYDPRTVKNNFISLKLEKKDNIPLRDLQKFVDEHFEDEEGLELWEMDDWIPEPKYIQRLKGPRLKVFAKNMHLLLSELGRKVNDNVRLHPDRYSLMYTPHPIMVPGGRFREVYYWDTYWILKSLLHAGMFKTVKAMLRNYVHLQRTYGLIPNGSRIYYTDRSQPPILIRMVAKYFHHTLDLEFLREVIPVLEQEFEFWIKHRSVKLEDAENFYTMFRYDSFSCEPRPEGYKEDYHDAANIMDSEKPNFYRNVRAAAESGIDFSGRWFIPTWTEKSIKSDINTSMLLPVDLNAILIRNVDLLAYFSKRLGDNEKCKYYKKFSSKLYKGFMKYMWNNEEGTWFDFDLVNMKQVNKYYASNFTPLWCGNFPTNWNLGDKTLRYLERNGILNFKGGIPSSLDPSGFQWDFPNAWAPHQDFIVRGLMNTEEPKARKIAKELATKWIFQNYVVYAREKVVYEKYNAATVYDRGAGGEYETQTGFGWSNGVLLGFLYLFPDIVIPEDLIEKAMISVKKRIW